jgi:hypothetical protein
VVHT